MPLVIKYTLTYRLKKICQSWILSNWVRITKISCTSKIIMTHQTAMNSSQDYLEEMMMALMCSGQEVLVLVISSNRPHSTGKIQLLQLAYLLLIKYTQFPH